MEQLERCKVCGGTIGVLGNICLKCDYCGQVYSISGTTMSQEQIYKNAIALQNRNSIEENEQAKALFEGIYNFRDSSTKVMQCYSNIEAIKVAEEERILEQRRAVEVRERERVKKEQRKKEYIKWASIISLFGIISAFITVMVIKESNEAKREQYTHAMELYENKEYESALRIFSELGDFENSQEQVSEIETVLAELEKQYNVAVECYDSGEYLEAFSNFEQLNGYEDTDTYISTISELWYDEVMETYENGEYEKALVLVSNIPETAECYEKAQGQTEIIEAAIKNRDYMKAVSLYEEGQLIEAQEMFIELDEYSESNNYLNSIGEKIYSQAKEALSVADYDSFVKKIAYIDSLEEWKQYNDVLELKNTTYKKYTNDISAQAKVVLRNQGYQDFLDYVNSAVNELFSQNDAQRIITEFGPIKLVSLDTYDCGSGIRCGYDYEYMSDWQDKTIKFTDNWGETYESGIYWYYGRGQRLYVEYDVREYSFFTASIICNYVHRTGEIGGYVKIYGDESLLYSSDLVVKGYETTDVALDISNVTILKIEFSGGSGSVDSAQQPSVVEPMVYK